VRGSPAGDFLAEIHPRGPPALHSELRGKSAQWHGSGMGVDRKSRQSLKCPSWGVESRELYGLVGGLPAVAWNISQVTALFLNSGTCPLSRTKYHAGVR